MSIVKVFAYSLAIAAVATSVAIYRMGARFQQVEKAAYSGKRPWWFVLLSALLLAFYLFALRSFFAAAPKTWAGWLLMVVIPLGWSLKAVLLVFNKQGRETVTKISGDANWRRIALARLPIALVLLVLGYLA